MFFKWIIKSGRFASLHGNGFLYCAAALAPPAAKKRNRTGGFLLRCGAGTGLAVSVSGMERKTTMDGMCLLCVLCLVAAQAGAESVASVDASGFAPFPRLDSDHNGYVSRVEARIASGLHEVFDLADANHDGLLDRKEYRSARVVAEMP